jgi:hypothetical protein
MKKILAITLSAFLCSSVAFADEPDEGLHEMAGEIQQHRSTVQSRIHYEDVQNRLRNRFGEDFALKAQRMIMQAKEEGLPAEPIMEKAYEGMAKGVPPEQILQAMKKVHSRYRYAHRHAKGLTKEEGDIHRIRNMIAQCLAAGLRDEDAGNIAFKLQQRAQDDATKTKTEASELATEAFRAARDMARLGATSMATTDTVWQAIAHGYSAKDVKTMRDSFVTNIRYASSATSLAKSYANSISRGEGPEMLWSSRRMEAAGTRRAMGVGPSGSGGTSVSDGVGVLDSGGNGGSNVRSRSGGGGGRGGR